jgi:hypothetical protein
MKTMGSKTEELQAEVARLSELLWGCRCVYCGEVVGKDKKNQDLADDVLRQHVEVCPKHPVATLKTEKARLQEALHLAWGIIEWMSGSPDFGPGGTAHEGWIKAQYDLKQIRSLMVVITNTE